MNYDSDSIPHKFWKSKKNFTATRRVRRHFASHAAVENYRRSPKTKTTREECYISQEFPVRLVLNSFWFFLHTVKVAKVLLKYDRKPKGHIQHPAYIRFSIYRRKYRRTFSSGVSWRDICLHISCIYFLEYSL